MHISVEDGKLLESQKPKASLAGEERSFPVNDESVRSDAPTQEEVGSDLQEIFRGAIRMTLEAILEQEVRALVGARRWQRVASRKDAYNGSYLRGLLTSLGHINVEVPRSRKNGAAGAVIGRYSRRVEAVDDAIVAAYVHGVSTRGMGKVTEALMDESVGRSTVSRVTRELEEKVETLRKAPIAQPIRYLFLDATFLDARWARAVENVSALVAYGVMDDGHRRLLAITIGAEESEASWTELLQQLVDRGLSGVKLVVADAHAGLGKAVRRLLPEVPLQRCIVHFERNVLVKAPHRLRARLGKELSEVFKATSHADAGLRLQRLQGGLGRQLPEAMAILDQGFTAATHYFAFPQEHWVRIRSTNGLERLNREIKRRTRAVGAFPDRASALRLVTAVSIRAAEVWSDRKYLDMSGPVIEGTPLDERTTPKSAAAP
jgi:transposase-like protein